MTGQKLTGLSLPINPTANQRAFANSGITEDDEVIVVLNRNSDTDWEWF